MIKHSRIFPLALGLMLLSFKPSMTQAEEVPERDKIPAEYKWHIEHIYVDDAAWEQDFKKVAKLIPEIKKHEGKLWKSGKDLLECLTLNDEINMIVNKLYPFAKLQQDENTANNKYQALTGRIQSLLTDLSTAAAFIEPEISAISYKKLNEFRKHEAGLKKYNFYFDKLLKQKKHILSNNEEQILVRAAQASEASQNIFEMLSNADMRFPNIIDEKGAKILLSEGRYSTYVHSSDRRVRQEAFDGLMNTYNQYRNTLAATLNGNVQQHVFYAKSRKYDSCLQAALKPNNIPNEVYNNLVTTINNNLEPLHRYVRLKKKVLGLTEMHMYDLYAPMTKDIVIEENYAQGLELVRKALAPLGPDYLKKFNEGISSGWVDVYENKGKRSGAYSWGVYGVHPYVLLNYNNQYNDVLTLAHEMGHAMHSYYSTSKQPFPTADYAIFTAETASTTNEILLIDYMLKNTTDKKKKLYLLTQYLENIRTTVYRQTMFAEFEKFIHEQCEKGEALTADMLDTAYHDLNVKYYGPDMIVDENSNIEWGRIPHFYRNFYVYQYANGYSAATVLAKNLQTQGVLAQNSYLHNFLEAGGSDTPINILKRAGVDMSSPEPIKFTLNKFNSLLDEYEKLLD